MQITYILYECRNSKVVVSMFLRRVPSHSIKVDFVFCIGKMVLPGVSIFCLAFPQAVASGFSFQDMLA
jgi:hypothetical protein